MAHDAHEHKHSARPYILTVLALYCLTILTFMLGVHVSLGEGSFAIAMAIAFTKGMLVILFFMHLWDQAGPNRLTMAIAVLFVILLIVLACADEATRFPLALPPGSFRSIGHTPPVLP